VTAAADPVSRRRAVPAIGPAAGLALAGAAAAVTVALPLLIYTTSLALFGLAHVVSELNYVDRRFSARLGAGVRVRIGVPVAAAFAALAAGFFELLPARAVGVIEGAAAAGLILGVLGLMRRRRAAGAAIGLLLAAGALLAPFQLLLTLAILHNLTPLGFFAEALSGAARRRALALLAVPLIGIPLVIASGWPFAVLARLGLALPEAGFLASGPLALNLGYYVPAGLTSSEWALHAFTAAVFAQITHYTVVIALLPRLLGDAPSTAVIRWPSGRRFVAAIAAAGLALVLLFVLDYRLARQVYALAALVHSWVEIPVLLLAWGGLAAAQPARA
jgi:hypothetical protein